MAGFTGAGIGAGMIFLGVEPPLHFVSVMFLSMVIIFSAQKYIRQRGKSGVKVEEW